MTKHTHTIRSAISASRFNTFDDIEQKNAEDGIRNQRIAYSRGMFDLVPMTYAEKTSSLDGHRVPDSRLRPRFFSVKTELELRERLDLWDHEIVRCLAPVSYALEDRAVTHDELNRISKNGQQTTHVVVLRFSDTYLNNFTTKHTQK